MGQRTRCTGSATFHWKSPALDSFGRLLLGVPAASACVECRHPTEMITTTMCRSVKQNKTGILRSAPLFDWMAEHGPVGDAPRFKDGVMKRSRHVPMRAAGAGRPQTAFLLHFAQGVPNERDNDSDDDDMRAFKRVLQHEAIPNTQQYCLAVSSSSKLNNTVPISRRLTVWAQPPQITILAQVGQFLPQTSCHQACERHGVIQSPHSRTRS